MPPKLWTGSPTPKRWQRTLLKLSAVVLIAQTFAPAPSVADTAPPPGELKTITADDLPTWQTDGVVWSIAVVGDVVYAGGNFDHIRPPGTAPGASAELPRHNLAAFNAATGEPLSWNPVVDAVTFTSANPQGGCDNLGNNQWRCDSVRAVRASADGTKLYVAGDFTTVNKQPRGKIASFTLPDGALTGFTATINSRVKALAVGDNTVYAGGYFTTVNGTPRQRLASFTSDGTLTPWAPNADRGVHAMTISPDGSRVILGGDFDTINGNPPHGLGAVHAGTGASASWATGVPAPSGSRRSVITDLIKDDDTIYAAAEGTGTFDGRLALNPDDGTTRWIDHCLGATQALTLLDGVLYSGSHAHNCSTQPDGFPEITPGSPAQRLLAQPARPTGETPPILHWFPNTNNGTASDHQGPRALGNNGKHLWVGGEFTTVNNQPQQGLTHFAALAAGQDINKPESTPAPQVIKPEGTTGALKVTWKQTWDRDNKKLTYEVVRNATTVVHTVQAESKFWDLQTMTFTDTGLEPGSTHTYSIRAIDHFGNRFWSAQSAPAQAG
ncbi:delta-60 repeat domain-containing protein [Spirillospora sp. CA-294931]|uniref:delta-60 repeat domain-containing protein n=1 Tax=Spirillospora sp. CA-294931 TaxID=3240042 RepID=UPI003D9234B7